MATCRLFGPMSGDERCVDVICQQRTALQIIFHFASIDIQNLNVVGVLHRTTWGMMTVSGLRSGVAHFAHSNLRPKQIEIRINLKQ